ncbi:hypothetical protein CASFOL_025939 [Castilleja foliolosa]|uniref:Protein BIG GRAIN 1-like A n=1 Tax=Castilleja foliolosa TaxID=1961234 RepID=A0ABD3CSI6_9LAMI
MEIRTSKHSPSFSSTLLDSIYRSIDLGEDEIPIYSDAARKTNQNYIRDEEMANLRRACMIEKWMEKKVSEKAVVRRKSAADLQTVNNRKTNRPENFSWSSSDSSGTDFFSSSETESFPLPRPKPVRIGGLGLDRVKLGQNHKKSELNRLSRRDSAGELDPTPKDEGGFLKKVKIYRDLKKVKQPISPGGKLAGFLNTLFSGKPKMAARGGDYSPSLKSMSTSTCSSASSFTRSCLSKMPSSQGKSSNGVKRSVRFSPVSVIVDEDSKPEAKSIRNVINEELRVHAMEKKRSVEEAARDLLRNYQMKTREFEFSFDNLKKSHVKAQSMDQSFDYEEEDDDAASYASSDLFELDNLSAVGMDERYGEELPVYETTRLDRTNRARAKAMIY